MSRYFLLNSEVNCKRCRCVIPSCQKNCRNCMKEMDEQGIKYEKGVF